MKRYILITLLFFGLFADASEPKPDELLMKAERLMLVNPKESFRLAEKAYKNKNLDHKDKLQSLFILTNTSNLLQKPLDVIQYGNEALRIADNGDDAITKIKILGILGNTYQFLKLNEKTRIYLDQAELLLSSPKIPDSLNLVKGNIFYLKGMNYFYGLDSDIALSYFNKAINQYINSKNPLAEINIKMAYLNRGFALIQQKQFVQASESLELAGVNPDESSRPYPPQFVDLQETFIELGKAKILSAEGKPELSNEMLFEILRKRKDQPARDDIENEVYEILAENFLQLKDTERHDYYEKLFMKNVDAGNREAAALVNQLISRESSRYESEKESISQKYILLIAISSIFFGLVIIFLLFKTFKTEQKRRLLKKKVSENI
ncbi:hypothetical protein [Epilithonimonas mollis]|uniref:Tetratricopeptide repeat protein n=1 Tax=Epilithonimonas mollis TaxID=216903 RepID=A0A1M6R266_9FLAO|nr:hypothetical protein [Epilithonimonas mollis]SHK26569.1 hypothetical protein SAMN05444371_1648 [Epilithonimonas mollis]